MKRIIDEEYTRYGGDHDHILYLDIGITGNTQLCLQKGGNAIVLHLTSTDPLYQKWLYTHAPSLLKINEDNWYQDNELKDGGKYHLEFHYILKRINKLTDHMEH